MAWTAIPYVTLSITVFVCEQRPAQKLYSMAWTAIPYVTLSITVFFMCEHVRPKLSKNKPLNLLLKWKHWAVSNRSIFFLTLKNGRRKNSEKKQCTIFKWGTNSRYNLCLVAFFIHSSHITQCMILAGRNEFNNRTLLYNLHHCPNKSKASREVRFKSLVCNRNGRN